MTVSFFVMLLAVLLHCGPVLANWPYAQPNRYPDIPASGPKSNPRYMVDNQDNYFHAAPDKGKQNGPIWPYSGSFKNYMTNLKAGHVIRGGHDSDSSVKSMKTTRDALRSKTLVNRASTYWLPSLAAEGAAPLATQSGYQFFRNVVTDFGADNTGATDASESLNAAITAISSTISDGGRCGLTCGNTFTMGAIVYFPPGTYKICSPVIQLYYTQLIGDATNPPTILGCSTFTGIALVDTDPYIPGGGGSQWYVNQNQFFRQIRNFIFDLTQMPQATDDDGQALVPTGIHWQVAQATSLQNLVFNMPTTSDTTAVGIFTENGSGGFVSDLTFNGGAIGWRAGSQQYTARQLTFNGCLTAVQMVWDWGFVWQGIQITGGAIAFNISGNGGSTGQGIGSVSLVDCSITDVPVAVLTDAGSTAPAIVLDNLIVSNVANIVQVAGGSTLLAGTSGQDTVFLWASGNRYNGSVGSSQTGDVEAPMKAATLLDGSNSLYVRSRPQYETLDTGSFLIATKDGGCANDGTGDQAVCINNFLTSAYAAGQIAYFPAGIYQVGSTVFVPTGSRIQGASWSQIQGSGFFFSDINNPQVMVKVGNKGETGSLEIVEMLFSVRGPTAGIILMEWNVKASSLGNAGMWDSHFRVGGAAGSDLDQPTCPKFGFNDQCIAASLMFHVTSQASGYFENVWAWVADHDNDFDTYDNFDPSANQVSIYGARGMLIESKGPAWFYGTSSEHSVLYNYQLSNAANIYMSHIQTETPYFQPNPVAPQPFDTQIAFPGDPSFADCATSSCAAAWGLRIVNSANVTVHGAGLYSFFQDFYQDCDSTENCQEEILEVTGSTGVVIFNLFTVATVNIASGIDNTHIFQNVSQSGFTTEVAVWLPLPGSDNVDVVYIGTGVWSTPVVACDPPCILVFPTQPLPTPTTIPQISYTTSLEYGGLGTTKLPDGQTVSVFVTTTTTVTIVLSQMTVGIMSYSNVNVTLGQTDGGFIVYPSVNLPPFVVPVPNGVGTTSTSRTLELPPWPEILKGPPNGPGWGNPTDPWAVTGQGGFGFGGGPTVTNVGTGTDSGFPLGATSTYYTQYRTTVTATGPTVTTLVPPTTVSAMTVSCPPDSAITFSTPKITISTDCSTPTVWTIPFSCPTTKVVTFLAASIGAFTFDCTVVTSWSPPSTVSTTSSASPTTTPLPVWTTWPNVAIYPVTTTVPSPQPTSDGVVTPCDLWFFGICIRFGKITIGGWHWALPPGIYPPGPPPPIKWPSGWDVKASLPPWPKITIGRDNQITYSEEPTSCTTKSALVCSTTTFYSVTVEPTATVTTFTSASSSCQTVFGCDVSYSSTSTTSVSSAACASATAAGNIPPPGCPANAVVYPVDPDNVGNIPQLLSAYADVYVQSQSSVDGFTNFFWVPNLDQKTMDTLTSSPDVSAAYYYEAWNEAVGSPYVNDDPLIEFVDTDSEEDDDPIDMPPTSHHVKRDNVLSSVPYWDIAQVSLPPNQIFQSIESQSFSKGPPAQFNYWYDSSAGEGQYVYIISEDLVWTSHAEFAGRSIQSLAITENYGAVTPPVNGEHGSAVAAKIIGNNVGVCKNCTLVWFDWGDRVRSLPVDNKLFNEKVLQQLTDAYDNIMTNGQVGKAVINLSLSFKPQGKSDAFYTEFRFLLNKLDIRAQAAITIASGNHATSEGREISRFPAKFASPDTNVNPYGVLPNLMVVGGTDFDTYQVQSSQYADYMTAFAPGSDLWLPADETNGWRKGRGTSYAAPQVAALAGYLRGLPSQWQTQLRQPANVKALIQLLNRRFMVMWPHWTPVDPSIMKPVIWNGQVRDKSCIVDYATRATWDTDGACPDIPTDLSTLEEPIGESVQDCSASGELIPDGADTDPGPPETPTDSKRRFKRDAGGACPTNLGDGSGGGGQSIAYSSAPTPSPTCASGTGCGGILCTGYYCVPNPTGVPPDYPAPNDPNGGSVGVTTSSFPRNSTSTTTTISPSFLFHL